MNRWIPRSIASSLLVLAVGLAADAVGAAASSTPAAKAVAPAKCSGTFSSPGVLQGSYPGNVEVVGFCLADGSPATIAGNLMLAPGAALDATFARDDLAGGASATSVTVDGNLVVESGAVLFLGCEPNFSPCSDAPGAFGGDRIAGSLVASGALGVVLHVTTVGGSLTQTGGGGGVSCAPAGAFKDIQSPPFSDYEDDTVLGNVSISGLRSCWIGSLRDAVTGSFTYTDNVMADPDAGEVIENVVHGNLICSANVPAVQYGDSGASPNVVYGTASGECGFDSESLDQDWYFPGRVATPNESISLAATFPISQVPHPAIGLSPSTDANGYLLADAAGSISKFGDASGHGSWPGAPAFPVAGFAAQPHGSGYWLVTSTGQVRAFGSATVVSPAGGVHTAYPVVGMAATPDGMGYWLAAADGGVFAYGDARFHGSEGGKHLNSSIVGIAATPDGRGYWLVAADGGVFAFGDARFHGSEGGHHLNEPVVGMSAGPGGLGYWLVAADGGIFGFGSARFHGSNGSRHLNTPVTGMAATSDGNGYWLVGEDGGVFAFGDARFFGSAA